MVETSVKLLICERCKQPGPWEIGLEGNMTENSYTGRVFTKCLVCDHTHLFIKSDKILVDGKEVKMNK